MTNISPLSTPPLIIGGSGMIGTELNFGEKPSRKKLNINDNIETYLERYPSNFILCLASLNLRDCEKKPIEAFDTNLYSIERLAKTCHKLGIQLGFMSTGAIFNGEFHETFDEDAKPHPVNLYGKLKYLAEELIKSSGCDYQIYRTGWVFGSNDKGNQKFVDIAARSAILGKDIYVNNKQMGSPTSVFDLSQELERLIKSREKGVFHLVNEGKATALDIAKEITEVLSSSSRLIESPPVEKSFIQRSPSEALVSSRGIQLRHWKESIREYILYKFK